MKHRLKAALLAAALFLSAAGGCTASRQTTEYITAITVQQASAEEVSYTQETKDFAAQTLLNAVDAAVTSAYGENATVVVKDYEQLFYGVIDSCEARGISTENLLAIVGKLCENDALLVEYLTDSTADNYYLAVQLLAVVTEITGTNNACLLAYDFSELYCDFRYGQYYSLYEQHGYPYLLRYAENWSQKKQSLSDIGEENFIYLLKISLSAVSVYSSDYTTAEQLLSGFSAGEAALFLRAQGYMSQKISLTAEGWSFVMTSAAESGCSDKLTAIYNADVIDGASASFGAFFSDVAYALTQTTSSCVGALMDGDYSAFLYRFLSVWTEEEWSNFAALLSDCKNGSYAAYFSKIGAEESFASFTQSVTEVTLNGLLQTSESEFYGAFKNFVASYSPELAFIIFEL